MPITRSVALERGGDQRADLVAEVAQAGVLRDVAHQDGRASLDRVDRDALVEPEELLLQASVGGAEVGANHVAAGLLVLQAQDRVVRFEHHGGGGGAQPEHLGGIRHGDHANAGLVDGARPWWRASAARLALRRGDLLRRRRGDLEQRLLGASPARCLGAGLDREHARERVAGHERQRGVGEGAVGPAQEGGLARLGDRPVDALAEPDAVLLAEAAALERGGGEAEVVLVRIVEVEGRDSAARCVPRR